MFVDSHCHLDFSELHTRLPDILANMQAAGVEHALCISVTLETWPQVMAIVREHPGCLSASVGVHPDYLDAAEPTVAQLVQAAMQPEVVGIGETGLDYYRIPGEELDWQRERFRVHIRAARQVGKPLIIHTRSAAQDTLRVLREEGAESVGGVMHCFTEDWEIARQALDLGFYISLSGIVSFKNAGTVHEVARRVPADRLLIETDSPFLAPVPYRGKPNEPAWVVHVAEAVAKLRQISVEAVGQMTTENYDRLFGRGGFAARQLHPAGLQHQESFRRPEDAAHN
ncbi:MAG: TatD family hydrolase [Lautropia sp.]|nr:TatD family hydrolase [Lautropia sp.]